MSSYNGITYTENLIERALQIADLTNCDFISHDEQEAILNEQIRKVYSDLITINDKYFTNIINDVTNEMSLPSDFFVMEDIYEELPYSTSSLIRLNRPDKSKKGYYILGNKLYLSRTEYPVTMIYFTKPKYYEIQIQEVPGPYHEIDMPNNILVEYISYLMAIQFKAKQGASFDLIQQSAKDIWESYVNLIDRDAHDFEQVTNVYM